MKNYFIVTTWDFFREIARHDAELWKSCDYTADDLTIEQIINDYPDFVEYSDKIARCYDLIKVFETLESATKYRNRYRDASLYSVFSLEEIAQKTLEYME